MIRPPEWAVPIIMGGVDNLFRVSDGLYRSAQPTHEGMENLQRFGLVKTIINLRWLHSDSNELKDTDLLHDERAMTAWYINDEDVTWFLDMVTTPEGAPFLVHCQHGADRTGCMVAMYRMIVQDWTKSAAILELEHGGFGFHEMWWNIPWYLRHMDLGKIRSELQIKGGK